MLVVVTVITSLMVSDGDEHSGIDVVPVLVIDDVAVGGIGNVCGGSVASVGVPVSLPILLTTPNCIGGAGLPGCWWFTGFCWS